MTVSPDIVVVRHLPDGARGVAGLSVRLEEPVMLDDDDAGAARRPLAVAGILFAGSLSAAQSTWRSTSPSDGIRRTCCSSWR